MDAPHSGGNQVWCAGNYARIGSALLFISELLLEDLDPRAGQNVLDVACGHGNAVLAAARRSCRASGVDYVPELLEIGRERAAAERLRAEFVPGDAEAIPFPDASFDIVTSVMGSMFAENQQRTADELVRVCKPGGKIGLASWAPVGYSKEFNAIAHNLLPHAADQPSPLRWGTRQGIKELFGDRVASMQFTDREFVMRAPSVEKFVAHFEQNFGPLASTMPTMTEPDRERVRDQFGAAALRHNRAADGTLASPMAYLQAIMVKA